jgi:hypothetical protein
MMIFSLLLIEGGVNVASGGVSCRGCCYSNAACDVCVLTVKYSSVVTGRWVRVYVCVLLVSVCMHVVVRS